MRYHESRGFFVDNLSVVDCNTVDDLMAVVHEGIRNRHVAAHLLNKDSSRSHAAMTVRPLVNREGARAVCSVFSNVINGCVSAYACASVNVCRSIW